MRTQVELYERVLFHIQAGIPKEFYGFLIYEQETVLELEDAAAEGAPSEEELGESRLKFEIPGMGKDW